MTALPKRRFSEEEYLMIERAADYKSDFCDGEMYAMAGTSRAHSFVCGNIGALLHAQFKGRRCEVHLNEMRVRVADSGMYTYPDVVAFCGEPLFLDDREDTLINPQLVVEVLSPSTMDYDRGEKLWRYRQIKFLNDYLLVWQDRSRIEHGSRQLSDPHAWTVREYYELSDQIEIGALGVYLPLAEIYDRVDFAPQTAQS